MAEQVKARLDELAPGAFAVTFPVAAKATGISRRTLMRRLPSHRMAGVENGTRWVLKDDIADMFEAVTPDAT